MLRLGEEIERQRARVGVGGRYGDELARSLERVDPYVGRNEPLRRRRIRIPRTDDPVDTRDAPCSVRERRDRGRATGAVEHRRADERERVCEHGVERSIARHR